MVALMQQTRSYAVLAIGEPNQSYPFCIVFLRHYLFCTHWRVSLVLCHSIEFSSLPSSMLLSFDRTEFNFEIIFVWYCVSCLCVQRATSELVACLATSTTFFPFDSARFESSQFRRGLLHNCNNFHFPNIQLLNNIFSLLLLNNDKHKTSFGRRFFPSLLFNFPSSWCHLWLFIWQRMHTCMSISLSLCVRLDIC